MAYIKKLKENAKQYGLKLSAHKNNTVWQYWERKNGREIPGYIAYCMDRTKKQCEKDGLRYVLITPENLTEYIPSGVIPANYYQLEQIAHRADYVRVAVLLYYGGYWMDSDCLVVDTLRPLFDDLKHNDIVYFDIFEDTDVEVQIGLLGARQFSSIYYKWHTKINKVLSKSLTFDWTAIGGDLLRNIVNQDLKNKKSDILCYDQYETVYPLHWTQANEFFKNKNSDYIRRDFQPAVMLYNHIFPKKFKDLDKEGFAKWLKTSKTVLADLMRKT